MRHHEQNHPSLSDHNADDRPDPQDPKAAPVTQRRWKKPVVEDLPPLSDLTLQTGSSIGGGESVF